MSDAKKTNVTVQADHAVGMATSVQGANSNIVAFNIDLIAEKYPTKAIELLDLYKELKAITPDTPAHPDEDFGLAADQIHKIIEELDTE